MIFHTFTDILSIKYGVGGVMMAYAISDDCISCGACAAECPVGAISEGDSSSLLMQILVSNAALVRLPVL